MYQKAHEYYIYIFTCQDSKIQLGKQKKQFKKNNDGLKATQKQN